MRIRPLIILFIILIGIGGILFARIITSVPSHDEIKQIIASAWDDTLRDRPTFEGPVSFSLFPRPEFVLRSAKILSPDGTEISAERIAFRISMFQLLSGRYDVESMAIDNAIFVVPEHLTPRSKADTESIFKSLISYFDKIELPKRNGSIGQINLHNAQLKFSTPHRPTPILIHNSAIIADGQGGFSIEADANVLNTEFNLHASFDAQDNEAKRGRPTHFTYRDNAISVSGKGITASTPDIQFIGSVNMQSDNFQTVTSRFFGEKNPTLIAKATMQAAVRISFSAATLSEMQWTIGKSKLAGNMLADFTRATPRVTATLAATEMDLTDFVHELGIKRDPIGQWSHEQFPENVIPDLNLDLRMSADLVTIHDVVVKSVALSILAQDKKLEITLASADLFDGSLSGKIMIAPHPAPGLKLISTIIEFNQIDLERALVALMDSKRASGLTTGRVALRAEGASTADLIDSITGSATLDAAHTSFLGINLLNFLHRVEQKPLGAGLALKNGTTDFDTTAIAITFENGIGTFKSANFTRLPDLQIKLAGQINLSKQSFAISGNAIAASATSNNQSINLPFVLKGPFDNPSFLPDLVNLSKQSGMISP